MNAFTLRLDETLSKKLDRICMQQGYSKTGLVKVLIREFLDKQSQTRPNQHKNKLSDLVGIVNIGGDALDDMDSFFDEA